MPALSLPLPVIGWVYALLCGAALLLGAWLVIGLHLQGEGARRHLARNVFGDALLFGIWILGLASGIGVLLLKPWSRPLLEFFCWVLAAMTLLSAYGWWRRGPAGRGRPALMLSLVLFAGSVVALCGATIVTLRSPEVLRALSGL